MFTILHQTLLSVFSCGHIYLTPETVHSAESAWDGIKRLQSTMAKLLEYSVQINSPYESIIMEKHTVGARGVTSSTVLFSARGACICLEYK